MLCTKDNKQTCQQKAKKKLEDDMNIFGMINSITKMKAAVSAIIGHDHQLLEKSKENYFRNVLIVSDSEDERKIIDARSPFRRYL